MALFTISSFIFPIFTIKLSLREVQDLSLLSDWPKKYLRNTTSFSAIDDTPTLWCTYLSKLVNIWPRNDASPDDVPSKQQIRYVAISKDIALYLPKIPYFFSGKSLTFAIFGQKSSEWVKFVFFFSTAVFFPGSLRMSEWVKCELFLGKKCWKKPTKIR